VSSGAHAGVSGASKLAWGLVALVAILHYDFWYWDDRSLVFGFIPIGLAYPAGISLLAALAWALVVRFSWPTHLEEWADGDADSQGSDSSGAGPRS
jgi:hypothetical protein